jgi:hypothetical protein
MAQPPNPAPTLRLVNAIGNLLGAVVAFLYFRVVDSAATGGSRAGLPEVVWSIAIFAALIGIGQRYSSRWTAPIGRASLGEPLSPGFVDEAATPAIYTISNPLSLPDARPV